MSLRRSFPGGMLDEKETFLMAVQREVQEEIFVKDVQFLQPSLPDVPNHRNDIRIRPFLGYLPRPMLPPTRINYNREEVAEVFTLPIEVLMQKERMRWQVFEERQRQIIPVFEGIRKEQPIWGLTAYILYFALKHVLFPPC